MSITEWTPQDAADEDAKPEDELCPVCEADNIERRHHTADSIPECFYWQCNECEHQWGHS